MAADPDVRRSILSRYAVSAADRIGEDDEAEVYALGTHRIIKICKPERHSTTIERRISFYNGADARTISFAIPKIFDHEQTGGIHHTVEARIAGTSLTTALPHFDATRRRDALLAHAATAMEIGEIFYPLRHFGEIVSAPPLIADRWPDPSSPWSGRIWSGVSHGFDRRSPIPCDRPDGTPSGETSDRRAAPRAWRR